MTSIKQLKRWYNFRSVREKMLTIGLIWAFLYAVFYFTFFKPLDKESSALMTDINEAKNQLTAWSDQINTVKKIGNTPLYKQWLINEKNFQIKKNAYKSLLSSSIQWQSIVRSILLSSNNVTIEQIKNFPESIYVPPGMVQTTTKIYQQKMMLVIYSNYFDTINYIRHLEKILPTIHWDNLNYQVVQYPMAKIEMEFSVLYEKNNKDNI
ncbi:MAG: hypothetical protein ACD_46C00080G0009 [uncultured bacterium]|nr:MAG: hypothetical protein ACD_46C00080G0009 [uncultured bacterium]